MKPSDIRKFSRELQRIHERLGDEYLALCDASNVEPLAVVWSTMPPIPEGVTQAYVCNEPLDSPEDQWGQPGLDVYADTRAELPHAVFLHVLTRRCLN